MTSQASAAAAGVGRRLRGVTRDQWFFAAFALLLLIYAVALVTAVTSVGRGGR